MAQDGRTCDASRGPSSWATRALLGPLAVAAVLAGAAVVTVEHVGCDDPPHYVVTTTGPALVGGCVDPHDLPMWPGNEDDRAARRG